MMAVKEHEFKLDEYIRCNQLKKIILKWQNEVFNQSAYACHSICK